MGMFQNLFIDGIQGALISSHAIKINCFSRILAPLSEQNTEERVVVGRLVVNIDTFFSSLEILNAITDQIKQQTTID